jgi:hypothetical protein
MNKNQTESKPPDAEQESGKGLDETPCSPLRYFDGLTWAVFNCRDNDKRKGREAVKEAFGEDGWARVRSSMKSGIMEIFQHPPTPETRLYAETVGHSADRRAYRANTKIEDR